jgi:choline dehydrogenase-like flavoprotein
MQLDEPVVIGSGPAAVSVARGLVAAGRRPVMLDWGEQPDAATLGLKQALQQRAPHQWTSSEREQLNRGFEDKGGIPLKRYFGSDYVTRDGAGLFADVRSTVGLRASTALGGLSQLWGATLLRLDRSETAGWPFPGEQLARSYDAIERHLPVSGQPDALERDCPLPSHAKPVGLSAVARGLLMRMQQREALLRGAGFSAGAARLALRKHCVRCNECMTGCPHDAIFSSGDWLPELIQLGCRYQGQIRVDSLVEQEGGVVLNCTELAGNAKVRYVSPRVYVAAGALGTARLLLDSFAALGALSLRDSQYFIFPMITPRLQANASEPSHSLAQLFLILRNQTISEHVIVAQLYTYMAAFTQQISRALGVLPAALRQGLASSAARRIVIVQGYLHSDDSTTLELSPVRRDRQNVKLDVSGREREGIEHRIRAYRRFLRRFSRSLGMWPLPVSPMVARPGQGCHIGAMLPMHAQPARGQSDSLGRPFVDRLSQRIHVVDASVLPSIPSGPITLTIMANAYRIGFESGSFR